MTYTPSTDEIRGNYIEDGLYGEFNQSMAEAEFDRWLAAHDAEVRAEERARIVAAIDTALQNAEEVE